mmetsp:Transcript_28240/g.81257  ORF Transcript_28240/g.81257 Transcript_28240/m.81257 type:complete len:445 (-) Transcript_28240:105-1439(-)
MFCRHFPQRITAAQGCRNSRPHVWTLGGIPGSCTQGRLWQAVGLLLLHLESRPLRRRGAGRLHGGPHCPGTGDLNAACPAAPPLESRGRGTPHQHLEDARVGPEPLVLGLVCEGDDDRQRREGAEERRLEHEGEALLINAHIVERVVLAAQGTVRPAGEVVEAPVHLRRELRRADPVTVRLGLEDGLRGVLRGRQEPAVAVCGELVLRSSHILQDVLNLRKNFEGQAARLAFHLQHGHPAFAAGDVLLHEDVVVVLKGMSQRCGHLLWAIGLHQGQTNGVVLAGWLHDEGCRPPRQDLQGRCLQVNGVQVPPQQLALGHWHASSLASLLSQELVVGDGAGVGSAAEDLNPQHLAHCAVARHPLDAEHVGHHDVHGRRECLHLGKRGSKAKPLRSLQADGVHGLRKGPGAVGEDHGAFMLKGLVVESLAFESRAAVHDGEVKVEA